MASLITKTASDQGSSDGYVPVQLVRVVGGATNNPDGTPTGGSPSFLPPGRAAAASSVPVVQSNEDLAEVRRATTGTTTSVTSSATAQTIKAANTSRAGITIANDSTAILYLLLGAGTVSATTYTYAMPPKGTVAATQVISGFTGIITGIWASANGFASVTELTF